VEQGKRDTDVIKQVMTDLIKKEPLANIDYISIADNDTLKELKQIKFPTLVSLAVKFGKTRLIDNIVLE
jgi:pantoate--beta-alanine ligase